MLEDREELQKITDKLVADILDAKVAQKKFYTDKRLDKEYWNLITPDAFDKKLVVISVLGYPERVGVWSHTLLRQSRTSDSSMESYFRIHGEMPNRSLGKIIEFYKELHSSLYVPS